MNTPNKLIAIFLSFLFAAAGASFAQTAGRFRVAGVVVEKGSGDKLMMATVTIADTSGTVAGTYVTEENGRFTLSVPDGKYSFKVSCTGYETVSKQIEVSGENVNLGKISLKVGEEIDAATVSANPLLMRKGSRVIYDVSQDPDKDKIPMMEMMSRIPDLVRSHSNGKLSYQNNAISTILVDDNENGLVNAARQYPMDFIKARYMSSIELVLPGDLEYGNSKPILLITLEEQFPFGAAARLDASGDTRKCASAQVDAVVNADRFGIGVNYNYAHSDQPTVSSDYFRETDDGSQQENSSSSCSWGNTHHLGGNVFGQLFNKKVQFNASLGADYSEFFANTETGMRFLSSEGSEFEQSGGSRSFTRSPFRLNGAARLSGTFGRGGTRRRNLSTWKLNYSYSDNASFSETVNYWSGRDDVLKLSENGVKMSNLTARFKFPGFSTKNLRVSSGANAGWYNRKYDNSDSESDLKNGLKYTQNILFARISAINSTRNDKVSFLLSLNGEYVSNAGEYVRTDGNSPLDYSEFNLNPDLSLIYRLGRKFSLSSGFAIRVRRPSVIQLNPYVDDSDPYNIIQGNPELKGQKAFDYKIGLVYNDLKGFVRMMDISLDYSNTNNAIARISAMNPDGVLVSTYGNLGRNRSCNVNISVMSAPVKGFSVSLFGLYGISEVTLPDGQSNRFSSMNLSANARWNPGIFEMYGRFSLRPTLSSVQSTRLYVDPELDLSVSRFFEKPKIGVSINFSEILHGAGTKTSSIAGSNFKQISHIGRMGRYLGVNVYWQFGKFRNRNTETDTPYDL